MNLSPAPKNDEFAEDIAKIRRHYNETFLPSKQWANLDPYPYLCQRVRTRILREILLENGLSSAARLAECSMLDVGCGEGATLDWLVELGADPTKLVGLDLLENRVARARARFAGVRWLAGDFLETDVGGPYEVVLLLAVLSSVVNPEMKRRIMKRCFELLSPSGILIFYDLMGPVEKRGSEHYKPLSFREFEGYLDGRTPRYFKRAYMRRDVAERLLSRAGLTATEVVQATGLFNIDATFAYVRAERR